MDIEIFFTAIFLSVAASISGIYMVLGQKSMYGDALSHSLLPGIVLVFLITGERSFVGSLIGALFTGVLVSVLIRRLEGIKGIYSDAAIGGVFVVFFALGILLISGPAEGVDLDQDCVLFGEIAFVPIDRWTIGDYDVGARGVWISLFLVLLALAFHLVMGRVMKFVSFNSEFARSRGVNPEIWNLLYHIFISIFIVLSFELVGVILILSFLVTPIAASWLVSGNMKRLISLSLTLAAASTTTGLVAADALDVSISGTIAFMQGVTFFVFLSYYGLAKKRSIRRLH